MTINWKEEFELAIEALEEDLDNAAYNVNAEPIVDRSSKEEREPITSIDYLPFD